MNKYVEQLQTARRQFDSRSELFKPFKERLGDLLTSGGDLTKLGVSQITDPSGAAVFRFLNRDFTITFDARPLQTYSRIGFQELVDDQDGKTVMKTAGTMFMDRLGNYFDEEGGKANPLVDFQPGPGGAKVSLNGVYYIVTRWLAKALTEPEPAAIAYMRQQAEKT